MPKSKGHKRKAYIRDIARVVEVDGFIPDIQDAHDHLILHFVPESVYKGKWPMVARELELVKSRLKIDPDEISDDEVEAAEKAHASGGEIDYSDQPGIYVRMAFIVGDRIMVKPKPKSRLPKRRKGSKPRRVRAR